MTDNRIEKIRAEIERLYNQSLADENRQADRGLERAANVSYGKSIACKELLSFIDSMQEEPKECMYSKDNYTDEDRKSLCEGCEEECEFNKKEELGLNWKDMSLQEKKDLVAELSKDIQKEEPISKSNFSFKAIPRLLEMVEPTDKAKWYVAKLAKALEEEGYVTDAKIVRERLMIMNGEKVAMATMDEELVREGLEEAATIKSKIYAGKDGEGSPNPKRDECAFYIGFKNGANWQKSKDAKLIINAKDDGYRLGLATMKQQLMAKAVDGEVTYGKSLAIPSLGYRLDKEGLDFGDKVKVIVIKEG